MDFEFKTKKKVIRDKRIAELERYEMGLQVLTAVFIYIQATSVSDIGWSE